MVLPETPKKNPRSGRLPPKWVVCDSNANYKPQSPDHWGGVPTIMWDGKAFVNGAPSPVSVKIRAAAAATKPQAVATPIQQAGALGPPGPQGPPRGPLRPPRQQSCNYCRIKRGVTDTTHWANTCPHNPFKK